MDYELRWNGTIDHDLGGVLSSYQGGSQAKACMGRISDDSIQYGDQVARPRPPIAPATVETQPVWMDNRQWRRQIKKVIHDRGLRHARARYGLGFGRLRQIQLGAR